MATKFKEGESVFFAFEDGETSLDCDRKPRMYKSATQFKSKFPFIGGKDDGKVKLVEYGPIKHGTIKRIYNALSVIELFECSECKKIIMDGEYANYCFYCGAKLGLEE